MSGTFGGVGQKLRPRDNSLCSLGVSEWWERLITQSGFVVVGGLKGSTHRLQSHAVELLLS